MKFSIFILTYVTTLGLVTSLDFPWTFGTCLKPAVVRNFDLFKFFSGRWYEQKSFGNSLWEIDGLCPTLISKLTNDGKIQITTYNFNTIIDRYVTLTGKIDTNYLNPNIGSILVEFTGMGGLLPVVKPMEIIGTDNESWAVVYSCTQRLFLKSEMSFVLTRNRTDVDQITLKSINQTITNAGIDISKYREATNFGCGPNEPEL